MVWYNFYKKIIICKVERKTESRCDSRQNNKFNALWIKLKLTV